METLSAEMLDMWARDMRDKARELFEKDGECHPIVLMLVTIGPDGKELDPPGMLPLSAIEMFGSFTADQRDRFSRLVRRLIVDLKALAVVFVTEAWCATEISKEQLREANERGLESMPNLPGRKEVVMVTYERRGSAKQVMWHAEIKREGDKVTLLPFEDFMEREEMRGAKSAGRFFDMMTQDKIN